MWTGAGGEQAGSGKEYWEAGQAHGKGIKQGGAGTGMSREQAEVLEPASQAAPLWLHARFPSCFSAFPVFRDFFPPFLWEMSHCRAGRGFAYICVLGGWAGHLKSNTFLIRSLPLNLAFHH